jgi:hypothetical protein
MPGSVFTYNATDKDIWKSVKPYAREQRTILKDKNFCNFPNKMQQNINNFYYQKLWNTFGLMVMLQAIQCILILFTKHKEALFIQSYYHHLEH